MREIDLSKAILRDKPAFEPFAVPARGTPLSSAGLPADESLLLMQRNGAVKTLLLKQMAYHHVAQGEANGEPYLISF